MTMTIYLAKPQKVDGYFTEYKFENIIKICKSVSRTRWVLFHKDGRSICVPIEWAIVNVGVDNHPNGSGYSDSPDAFEGIWSGNIKED